MTHSAGKFSAVVLGFALLLSPALLRADTFLFHLSPDHPLGQLTVTAGDSALYRDCTNDLEHSPPVLAYAGITTACLTTWPPLPALIEGLVLQAVTPFLAFTAPGETSTLYRSAVGLEVICTSNLGDTDCSTTVRGFGFTAGVLSCDGWMPEGGFCLPWVDGEIHLLGTWGPDTFYFQAEAPAPSQAPEPSSLILVAAGAAALWRTRRTARAFLL